MSDFKKQFGKKLKALRKSRKVTQERLAELIDMHYRQISKIETGDNFPSARTLEKICYTLKVSPSELFDFQFVYEGEMILNGTDEIPFYRAIKHGNVVTLEDYRGKKVEQKDIFASDCEQKFINISKKLNKQLIVEYFEEDEKKKIVKYNPDGSIMVEKTFQDFSKDINSITESLKQLAKNKEYIDFIKLAVESIENDLALDNLAFMVNGMKMARKK